VRVVLSQLFNVSYKLPGEDRGLRQVKKKKKATSWVAREIQIRMLDVRLGGGRIREETKYVMD
jgi:hypothetical protein